MDDDVPFFLWHSYSKSFSNNVVNVRNVLGFPEDWL